MLRVVGYELAALSRPFEASNLNALVLKIVSQPPHPCDFTAAPALKAAVEALLKKGPEERPSAAEVLELPELVEAAARLIDVA